MQGRKRKGALARSHCSPHGPRPSLALLPTRDEAQGCSPRLPLSHPFQSSGLEKRAGHRQPGMSLTQLGKVLREESYPAAERKSQGQVMTLGWRERYHAPWCVGANTSTSPLHIGEFNRKEWAVAVTSLDWGSPVLGLPNPTASTVQLPLCPSAPSVCHPMHRSSWGQQLCPHTQLALGLTYRKAAGYLMTRHQKNECSVT